MSNISNTKREIEEHSTKASPHHGRPTAGTALADNTGTFNLLIGYALTTDANGNLAAKDGVLDADTVDGKHASGLGKSTDEVQKETLIHSGGFAPGFGG